MTAFRFPPDARAKDLLAALDEWAMEARHFEAQNLWDVLSALRGPDYEPFQEPQACQLKMDTTAVIRAKTLPYLAMSNGAVVNHATGAVFSAESLDPSWNYHFIEHARRALDAIIRMERQDS